MTTDQAQTPCAEKLRLSDAVAKAGEAVYTAKTANQEIIARAAQRAAVAALDAHRKQHRC